ncbi:hypothetical protein C4H11_12550 [Bacteroides zoogleoformans]|uniref:Uncharacterized protein n=1 Tax=Bacteroides zoogleoformans TaxID=28119 RepID=A0ABM6TA29_9BACE|nr:hypothetical protein C4H11_12550 [Bacteroides zoogleoformans]
MIEKCLMNYELREALVENRFPFVVFPLCLRGNPESRWVNVSLFAMQRDLFIQAYAGVSPQPGKSKLAF